MNENVQLRQGLEMIQSTRGTEIKRYEENRADQELKNEASTEGGDLGESAPDAAKQQPVEKTVLVIVTSTVAVPRLQMAEGAIEEVSVQTVDGEPLPKARSAASWPRLRRRRRPAQDADAVFDIIKTFQESPDELRVATEQIQSP